jgi:hypothetical protein
LNVCRISDVRQTEIHTAELLLSEPSPFEGEIALAKLKKYKLPGSDQILAEVIQDGGETSQSQIHNLINSNRKNCMSSERGLLFSQFTRKAVKLTIVLIEEHHNYQLHTEFYSVFSQS